jgi:hypothetical protein
MSVIIFTSTDAKPTVEPLYSAIIRILKGYTAWYGKTYDEWCHEKAQRIYGYLRWCFYHRRKVELQELALAVYRERLNPAYFHVRKYQWKPYKERFLNFKPSPFIKNFLNYLITQLKEMGYIRDGYVVLSRELIRAEDSISYEMGRYLWGKRYITKEVRDEVKTHETFAQATDKPKKWVVEIRETVKASDEKRIEFEFGVRIWMERGVIAVPSQDLLVDLCTWKPDP